MGLVKSLNQHNYIVWVTRQWQKNPTRILNYPKKTSSIFIFLFCVVAKRHINHHLEKNVQMANFTLWNHNKINLQNNNLYSCRILFKENTYKNQRYVV